MADRLVIAGLAHDLFQVRSRMNTVEVKEFDRLYKRVIAEHSIDDDEVDFLCELEETYL